MDRPGQLTLDEQHYFLLGRILVEKFELVIENELTDDPDSSDSEVTDSAGRKPGQGTQHEKELWNDPERLEDIQYQ